MNIQEARYPNYRFPICLISHAIWLYNRFSLSYRDVSDLLLERGVEVSCQTIKNWNDEFGGKEITTEEYLRWLAVSRIYLDNFVHIRTSVLTKNEEALLGLDYGANDFDLPTEDEVTQLAGATVSHEFEGVLNAGRELGYTISIARHFRCQRRNNS